MNGIGKPERVGASWWWELWHGKHTQVEYEGDDPAGFVIAKNLVTELLGEKGEDEVFPWHTINTHITKRTLWRSRMQYKRVLGATPLAEHEYMGEEALV